MSCDPEPIAVGSGPHRSGSHKSVSQIAGLPRIMRRGILTQFLISDSVPLNTTGGLAQLGERLAGSQKVIGSSPLSSIGAFCNLMQGTAEPGISGLFSCASRSACDVLPPLSVACWDTNGTLLKLAAFSKSVCLVIQQCCFAIRSVCPHQRVTTCDGNSRASSVARVHARCVQK